MTETAQIQLIPLQGMSGEAVDRLRLIRNAPEVKRFMKNRHEISRKEHWAWYHRILSSDDKVVLCIEDQRNGLLGQVNASFDESRSEGVLGIYVSKEAAAGVGTSVQAAFNAYLFATFPVQSLIACVFPSNQASLKMYEKLGFEVDNATPDEEGLIKLKLTRARWRATGAASVKHLVSVKGAPDHEY